MVMMIVMMPIVVAVLPSSFHRRHAITPAAAVEGPGAARRVQFTARTTNVSQTTPASANCRSRRKALTAMTHSTATLS